MEDTEFLEFLQNPPLAMPEDEVTEEDISVEELRHRIWRDWLKLQRLEEQQQNNKGHAVKQQQCHEQTRRRKLAGAHEAILKNMLAMMEDGTAEGFVYGIIQKNGKSVSGASENLRSWWKEMVRFDQNGPVVIAKYNSSCSISSTSNEMNVGSSSYGITDLQDTTLSSIMSVLMQHCEPPQRKYPFEKGVPPPWWPTGKEEWWQQLGLLRAEGPPPYKKPHDLKKRWKVAVIMAIIKKMMPDKDMIKRLINRSRSLQEKLSPKEHMVLLSVVNREADLYLQAHLDASPLPSQDNCGNEARFYAGGSSSDYNVENMNQGQHLHPPLMNDQSITGNAFSSGTVGTGVAMEDQSLGYQLPSNEPLSPSMVATQPNLSLPGLGLSTLEPSGMGIPMGGQYYDMVGIFDTGIGAHGSSNQDAMTIMNEGTSLQSGILQPEITTDDALLVQTIEMGNSFTGKANNTTQHPHRITTEKMTSRQMENQPNDMNIDFDYEFFLNAPNMCDTGALPPAGSGGMQKNCEDSLWHFQVNDE